ncbi:hypothetical protein [Vibrio quintilis]|uniref:Uncharacterized protein n=1 Tax=Vibrio quintilis TaxID=1117707 RepID=A0A1M7Z3G9_9VIBR|nr:hypothetical protein [Vibrio quintilis]SHO59340.1 hypothetical protein VQ7734_05125 [Vibrio quintilis]
MSIKDRIESLEQQIYVACSEGDEQTVNRLEKQLEQLQGFMEQPLTDETLEHIYFSEDEWR